MGLRRVLALVLIAAHTERIRLGTGVVQISARTPAATAMQAVTLDHISNGRTILGLGVSGPQVVEGWYGMPSRKPLARTREYVEILRQAFRREGPLEFQGDHYQLPYTGEGAEGLGKPLKIMTHPLREIPIWIGAEGPRTSPRPARSPTGGSRSTTRRGGPRCITSTSWIGRSTSRSA